MADKITDKEINSVRSFTKDALKTDLHVDIMSINKISVLEKLKKNKETFHDRYLVIAHEPGRLLLIKSKLVGKSITENMLILTINEIKHYVHNEKIFCVELNYNERTKSIILCFDTEDFMNSVLINLLSVVYKISQCVIFEPMLTNISQQNVISKIDRNHFELDNAKILSLSYQILSIVEGLAINKNLYDLFGDAAFHSSNHIFDLLYILETHMSANTNKKQKKINLRLVLVILHSLNYVSSFSHIHLDGIPINEDIASRFAKLITRNEAIHSIAMRKTQIDDKIFYVFNKQMDKEIIRCNLSTKMRILDHLTLSHNALSDNFFQSMDGAVLCVKKLYLSRCGLNQQILSSVIDSVINYDHLTKIDLSLNPQLAGDSIVTFKLSQFVKKVRCLESILLKDCGLQLSFLQDFVTGNNSKSDYDYRQSLNHLDLSGNVMTHYGANAIGQILQNTLCEAIKINLSSIKTMDYSMLESILCAPFRSPFKAIFVEIVLSNVGFDQNEYLKALSNTIRFALQQKNDCNGIQGIDLSFNNLGNKFDLICNSYIANFYSLEQINFDCNFKLNQSKKGFYSTHIAALCSAIAKLTKLNYLSLRGDWSNNLYLTYDDLLPLLKFLANDKNECANLKYLYLDGNRIKDDGCKVIATSILTNNEIKIISIEDNKCTFKGFIKMIDAILSNESETKLCDIPIHSILDDGANNKKIKKNAEKIKKCIGIIQENRLLDIKEHEKEQIFNADLRRVSIAPHRQKSASKQNVQIAEIKEENEQSKEDEKEKPPMKKMKSNTDRLALMLNATAFPKLKPIKERSPIPSPSSPKTKRKVRIMSVGVEAELNKIPVAKPKNVNNAKSKRRKKTRKKLDI